MKKGTYTFTSGYGRRTPPKTSAGSGSSYHRGVDLAASIGTPIYAAGDGVVTVAALSGQGGFGALVRILHAGNLSTAYGHVNAIYVKQGQQVKQGDHIADVGQKGKSTGPHLHWQVEPNGTPVDPKQYVSL
jgi:murein DD-endopeptidase MepM/ murein hydrolase activator NlpD